MSHLYMYLPSNSNITNKTSDFSTKLSTPLKLDYNSRVALVEVIYKHSWNVGVGSILYSYDDINLESMDILSFFDSETIDSLVKRINETIKEIIIKKNYNNRYFEKQEAKKKAEDFINSNVNIVVGINPNKLVPNEYYEQFKEQKIIEELKNEFEYLNSPEFYIEDSFLKLKFHESFKGYIKFIGKVVQILELEKNTFFSKRYKYIKNNLIISSNINRLSPIDIIGQIYIYAPDLIEYQYIGEEKAPLLAIIVIEPNYFNKVIKLTLDPPHYLRTKQNNLESIRISVRDQFGNKILFENSNITLKLDFI